ncbi:MAG: hypothetical protein ACOCVZ_01955 [Gemmatimonadota bacterium]
MAEIPESLRHVDWSRTTWEGTRIEQMRRHAALPLERIIAALEEMEELTRALRRESGDQERAGDRRAGE